MIIFLHLDCSYQSHCNHDNCDPQASKHTSKCSSSSIKGRSFILAAPYPIRMLLCHSHVAFNTFPHLTSLGELFLLPILPYCCTIMQYEPLEHFPYYLDDPPRSVSLLIGTHLLHSFL